MAAGVKTGARARRRRAGARWLTPLVHIGSLLPLALIIYGFFSGGLGVDPIREMTLRTGKTALVLLLLSLACTPLNTFFGWKALLPLRKPLGLYAFLYVSIHLLIFLWLDYLLDPALIRDALFEKRYALAGFSAFLLLVPLAATSTRWAMRTLGRNWKRLHRLVYVAALLAVVHYIWLVKSAYTQPALFALLLALLLLARLPWVRRRASGWRRRLLSLRPTAAAPE